MNVGKTGITVGTVVLFAVMALTLPCQAKATGVDYSMNDRYRIIHTEEVESESDLYSMLRPDAEGEYLETETELPPAPVFDASDYLEIEDDAYKSMAVEVPAQQRATDEDVVEKIRMIFQDHEDKDDYVKKTTTGTVKEGDIVNIDFVGKKDGKSFDGGTAEGYDLEIGSGSFIDGFEDGLIGKKIGSEVDLNLTFPEGYPEEDLSGEDVVFHVTINYVGEMPELTDGLAEKLSYGQYNTMEDYKQSIRDEIDADYAEDHKNALYTAIMTKLAELYPVEELPEENVEYEVKRMLKQFKDYAASFGMKTENFIQSFYGMTQDEFVERELRPETEKTLIQEIILSAIAEKEDITVSYEELDEELETVSRQTGSSIDELIGDMSLDEIRSYMVQNKVLDWIAGIVEINEIK